MIHGDLNDHNVIVADDIGVIDFGDVHRSYAVAEVAIAAAYAAFGFVDPVEAIASVVARGPRDRRPSATLRSKRSFRWRCSGCA